MKAALSILFLTIFPFLVFTQECDNELKGKIIDYHSRDALEDAVILVLGTSLETSSDSQGNYLISGICNGSYQLEVSHPECATIFVDVEIDGDRLLNIRLEHHLEELEEVQVIGDVLPDKTNSALEEKLDQELLESYSAGTLGDALRELNGISSLNTGSNIVKPTIHGLNGSRVLILNDGVRMQDMEWGDEHAPNLDINTAGSVSVIKGASALQYGGDAIGGTIIVEQARILTRDSIFGRTLLNGISNGRGGSVSTELTRSFQNGWFIKGQASYKRLGDREAPDYILSNTGIRELGLSFQTGRQQFTWGWDLRYSYFSSDIAILRASHIGNIDDLIRSINSGQPEIIRPFTYDLQNPRQEVNHHLGKLRFYKRFEGLGKWNVQYDFQLNRRFEYDVRRGEVGDRASIDLELTTHTLTTDFKYDAKENLNIHFGLLGRYQDNFPNPATGVRRLIPDYERLDFGTFLTGEFRIDDKWLLEAGTRYDFSRMDALKFYQTSRWNERGYNNDFQGFVVEDRGNSLLVNPILNYHNISFTAGANYNPKSGTNLKLNYALAQRAPNPSELFSDGLHHSAARIELGDLRNESETSHKFTVSLEKDYNNWGFTIEPYVNFIRNFILLEPTGVEFTIRGAFPVWEYNQIDARILGTDLLAYINWAPAIQSEHRFSIVKGRDVLNDIPLINIPAANFRNEITFKKPEWKNFSVGVQSNYVFRQNETPENISVFSPEQQEEVILRINDAPDAYHLMSFRSQMEFPIGKSSTLTTSLMVDNLWNVNYREYLNRQRFFADDLGRNILIQLKFNY